MVDNPFGGRHPRVDLNEAFPAALVEALAPALLGDSRGITAALVAAYLLDHAARAGGTRVLPSSVQQAVERLERAVDADARRWCADEANRIARWCVAPPEPGEVLDPDRRMMARADRDARVSVLRWAIQQDLDVELEWYDEAEDRWPRMRATPIRVLPDDDAMIVRTSLAEIEIPIANLRWLMPVERRERADPQLARVLPFGRVDEEE